MTKSSKTILLLTFLTCMLVAYSQKNIAVKSYPNENAEFSLTLITYNHAEQFVNGTLIYYLNDSNLSIKKRYMFSEIDSIVFSKRIDERIVSKINTLKLDKLEDFYYNKCVLPTSGNEYSINYSLGSISKRIRLHHYYQKQVAQLAAILDKQLPENYKIDYLSKLTKQNCK